MKKIVLFLIFLIIIFNSKNYAHDNNVIHPFTLTGKAWELLWEKTKDKEGYSPYIELKNYFYDTSMPSGYELGGNKYDISKIGKSGTLGSIEEDEPAKRTFNHFYNPKTGEKLGLGDMTAIEKAEELWKQAIESYNIGVEAWKKDAYYKLGQVLHLLEDMSSIPHPEDSTARADFRSTIQGTDISFAADYIQTMKEMAEESFEVGRVKGILSEDELNPAGSDLGEMFPASGAGAKVS